jgi:hypothetical protein
MVGRWRTCPKLPQKLSLQTLQVWCVCAQCSCLRKHALHCETCFDKRKVVLARIKWHAMNKDILIEQSN